MKKQWKTVEDKQTAVTNWQTFRLQLSFGSHVVEIYI